MSDKSALIRKLKTDPNYRAAYIRAKINVIVPSQIRALRLNSPMRQEDLAAAAGMKQPRVSAMERPGATNFNLETLIRLAAAFKVGLIVRFASHSEMLEWENDFSQDAFDIVTLDRDSEFVSEERPASQPNIASTLGDGIITICIAPQHVARTTTAWVDRPSGFVPQSQRAQNYVVQGG